MMSLDIFYTDGVTPKGMNKQWIGANGDVIVILGEHKKELVNVYTCCQIPLSAVFEASNCLDIFFHNDHYMVMQKIVIC